VTKKTKIAIFISGRGSNMQAIVKACQEGILKDWVEVVLVFANKENAAGLDKARAMNIPTKSINDKGFKRTTYDEKVLTILKEYEIDYLVLAGYMRILSAKFIAAYPQKIINIHPADTKLHQGLNAYKWAFDTKRKETKITVHFVDEGVDTGSVIAQKIVDLQDLKTLDEIEQKGLSVEHTFYSEVLLQIAKKQQEKQQ